MGHASNCGENKFVAPFDVALKCTCNPKQLLAMHVVQKLSSVFLLNSTVCLKGFWENSPAFSRPLLGDAGVL